MDGVNVVYNRYCYYRCLAVAAAGGGWMSDFDVLPMNMNSQLDYFRDGSFSIYSAIWQGGGIPCLMSGSKSEWERMTFAIIDNGLAHPDKRFWSDMLAAIDVYQNDQNTYRSYDQVADSIDKVITDGVTVSMTPALCTNFADKLAAHLSHRAFKKLDPLKI